MRLRLKHSPSAENYAIYRRGPVTSASLFKPTLALSAEVPDLSISFQSLSRPNAEVVGQSFIASLYGAQSADEPYRHWTLSNLFSPDVVAALRALPFQPPELGGVSGARELHNNTRRYFDAENNARYPVCGAVAAAFQSPEVVGAIRRVTGAPIDDCFLRIEYAQDIDGFWLKPHTDLGVKKLTLLYYLGEGEDQADLGTDIYSADRTWAKRYPFDLNSALIFVPSDSTWHGFEPRRIKGVRKSVIINYVTDDWIARDQLAYPQRAVCEQAAL